MRTNRGDSVVDTKEIGQPFTLKGTSDQDFGEWTHEVRTFMLARFGDDILTAWAARQQRIVVKTCVASQRNRMISWIIVFGEQAGEDEIENFDDLVGKFYAYHVSFTTDAANRIVRNSGEGNGLEAWRRLHSEYDPTSSMRRVAILKQVQNPPRCQRVEDLGTALEDWLSEKRQYEMFTDRNGRPSQASDEGFQELYDRLLAYSSTKQSIQMSESKKSTERDDPMDVDALIKGAGKGKSKGKGKKSKGKGKGKGKPSNAENSNWQKSWTVKGDEHSDGWTWKGEEQADGWWKMTDWQTIPGSGWWTTVNDWTPWESEETMGQIEINNMESLVGISSTEQCSSNSSKNPRRVRRRGPRKKRQTVVSPTPTDQRVGRRRAPIPAATPRSKSTQSPSQDSATSEPSRMSETKASDASETSSTSSVGTLTRLHTDVSSYNSDGKHVVRVVPCAPTVLHAPVENRSRTPSEMERRKYVVESTDTRANPRDTLEDQIIRANELVAIHDTIELRNDDDSLELFDQCDEWNQEIQAKCNVKHSGECLNLESRNLVPGDLKKLSSKD